jgi:NAD-dependent SIR2 family protein deacetylase
MPVARSSATPPSGPTPRTSPSPGWSAAGRPGFLLVTQNVDDLHDRAGSRNMLHMHGELMKARCTHCEAVHPWPDDLSAATPCPACARSGGMRPHVVWFGEMPLHMEEIGEALERCGSSCRSAPAGRSTRRQASSPRCAAARARSS